MRNLVLFSIAFAVTLSEADVDQLGYNVSETDFKNHFGIPEEATQESGFVKSADFSIEDLFAYMSEEERAALEMSAPTAPTEETSAAPAETKEMTKKEKADAKAKEKADAKAAKDAEKAKAKAEKEAAKEKSTEQKKPGVIASILEIIKTAKEPVTELQITKQLAERFPDKAESSLGNTVKAQIGGKAQPLRMESEKNVTFKVEERVLEEGKKAVRFYSFVKENA